MFYVSPYLYVTLSLIIVIVLALTIVAVYKGWFRWNSYSYTKATSSPISPILFFLFRFCVFVYAVVVLGVSYYLSTTEAAHQDWGNTTKGEFFSYYTIWNYILFAVFFFFASIYSFTRIKFGKQNHHEEEYYYDNNSNKSKYWFLGTVVLVLFEIAITMSVLVDTVLWGILYPYCLHQKGASFCNQILFNFESINCHILNFFVIFTEFALNRLVMVPAHVLFILYWAFSYMVFAWIYYGMTSIWDYPFMETSKSMSAANYAGLLLLHVIYFFVIFGLDRLKLYLTKRNVVEIHYENLDIQEGNNGRGIVIF